MRTAILSILAGVSLLGCNAHGTRHFDGEVVREVLDEKVADDLELRVVEIASEGNSGQWRLEAGCLVFPLKVRVEGLTRRVVQFRETTWTLGEDGDLHPTYELVTESKPIRSVPLDVWDHPVTLAFQITPGDGGHWLDEADPQLLLTAEPAQSHRSETRELYLCQSERARLLRYPASSYQVVVRVSLVDDPERELILDLRTRLPRELVAGP